MGGSKDINRKNGGFHLQKWHSTETIAGFKVIRKKPEYSDGKSEDPPAHSNTSKGYWGVDAETGKVHSLKFYEDRDSFIEYHSHKTTLNEEGVIHYHQYTKKNGKIVRINNERRLSKEQIALVAPLFQEAYERNLRLGIKVNPPSYDFKEKPDKNRAKPPEQRRKQ